MRIGTVSQASVVTPAPLHRVDSWTITAVTDALADAGADQKALLENVDCEAAERLQSNVTAALRRQGLDVAKPWGQLNESEQERRATAAFMAGWNACDPSQPFDRTDPGLKNINKLFNPKDAAWILNLTERSDAVGRIGLPADDTRTIARTISQYTQGYLTPSDADVDTTNFVGGAVLRKLQEEDKVLNFCMPNDPMTDDAPKRSLGEKFRGWMTTRGYTSSPVHKVALGGFVAGAATLLAKTAAVVASLGAAPAVLGGAAALAALRVGYSLADLGSGIAVHQPLDQFLENKTARAFQRHHLAPDISRLGNSQCAFEAGKVVAPATVALAAGLPVAAMAAGAAALAGPVIGPMVVAAGVCGAVGLLTGAVVGQISHKYSHSENVPKVVQWLQKAWFLAKPDVHQAHHDGGNPTSDYCILTGEWNQALDSLKVPQRAEKLFHLVTDKKPHDWIIDPSLKEKPMSVNIPGEKFIVGALRKLTGRG